MLTFHEYLDANNWNSSVTLALVKDCFMVQKTVSQSVDWKTDIRNNHRCYK